MRRIEVGLHHYAALPQWAQLQVILSVLRRHECPRSRQTSLCSKLSRVSDYLGCSVFRAIHLSSSSLLKRQSEPILIAGILAV